MMKSRRLAFCLRLGLALFAATGGPTFAQPAPMASTPFGIFNAVEIEPGVISAGQPTADQLEALQAAGYKTILDLRATSEDRGFDEVALAKTLGLGYENVPITLDTLDAADVERFRAAYKNAPRPLLLHCASANRTGALFYTYLVLDQKLAPEAALEKARAAGLKSPPLEEKVKALVPAGKP